MGEKQIIIIIIGSGFSSLSAACYLAKEGYKVHIFEKNDTIGGRARQFSKQGFTFDMGPTFYWMPDVMEKFFADFGKKPSDYYELTRLDPGYSIYFGKNDMVSLSSNILKIYETFENIEPGSSKFLKKFLKEAGYNYKVAMEDVVYRQGKSPLELIMPQTATRIGQFIKSLGKVVRKNIKSEKLRQILEFPVLFLGAKPDRTPSFYRFMNYADMILGTWHIKGGMFKLVDALSQLAESMGVEIHTSSPVNKIVIENNIVTGVIVKENFYPASFLVSGADYHHTELLLEKKYRNYTESYWSKRIFAPSSLLFFVGFNKTLKNISHHTLFFDTDFKVHSETIYDVPKWPEKPLFYASFPGKTDTTLCPSGKETGIFLIPIAPGLKDNPETREKYFNQIIFRMENITGQNIMEFVEFKHSFAVNDFILDYNAYKGNAYGLSNILLQTAFLKPKMQNNKIKNLLYTGQLTVPGPGVPTTIISGKIAGNCAKKYLKKTN